MVNTKNTSRGRFPRMTACCGISNHQKILHFFPSFCPLHSVVCTSTYYSSNWFTRFTTTVVVYTPLVLFTHRNLFASYIFPNTGLSKQSFNFCSKSKDHNNKVGGPVVYGLQEKQTSCRLSPRPIRSSVTNILLQHFNHDPATGSQDPSTALATCCCYLQSPSLQLIPHVLVFASRGPSCVNTVPFRLLSAIIYRRESRRFRKRAV